jgi:hypothetical protein
MIKALQKLGIEQNEGYISQTNNQYDTEWRKTEHIFSKIRNDTRVSTLTTLIQYSVTNLSQSNKTNERVQVGNKEVKLPMFSDDMIL